MRSAAPAAAPELQENQRQELPTAVEMTVLALKAVRFQVSVNCSVVLLVVWFALGRRGIIRLSMLIYLGCAEQTMGRHVDSTNLLREQYV